MMLIYAALLNIPEELTMRRASMALAFPHLLPHQASARPADDRLVSVLTFVANFNAFDLIYSVKGALAGPNFATDILGTFFYRTFFGNQLQLGNPTMGAAVATVMFFIILAGVCLYLFLVQRRIRRYAYDGAHMTVEQRARSLGVHLVLIAYSALAIGPILLVVMNSFKARNAIFGAPLAPPDLSTFSLVGYQKVLRASNILTYYSNSLIVTLVSMALVLLFGAMAAWALTEYRFRGSTALALFLSVGIMVPIRLGSVAILNMMRLPA